MSTLLNQIKFFRLWHKPTLVVIAAALLKWFTSWLSLSVLWSMSLDFKTHLKSKQGLFGSLFWTQPRFFKAFLMSGYPPVHINTLTLSSTLNFFFHSARSYIFGNTTVFGLFLFKKSSRFPSPVVATTYYSCFCFFFFFFFSSFSSSSPSSPLDS